jgi:hypothetical protein
MATNQLTLAGISIAVAVGIVLLSRLPRPVLVLIVSSVIGAVIGVLTLLGRTLTRECDFASRVRVDRCSGLYVALMGDHRLPQFMQGDHADAWLVGIAALFGAVLVDIVALAAIWAWSQIRRRQRLSSAA